MIRYAIPKPEPLRVEHETFRDAVLGKEGADIVTMQQGLTTVRVAEAVHRVGHHRPHRRARLSGGRRSWGRATSR